VFESAAEEMGTLLPATAGFNPKKDDGYNNVDLWSNRPVVGPDLLKHSSSN